MSDLPSLAELRAKATPGPWIRKWASMEVHAITGSALRTQEDVDYVVALVNAHLEAHPSAPRFRELDEIEWSRPGLTPDQVADYRAAILRDRA